MLQVETKNGARHVALQGELTIYQAHELSQDFLPLLDSNEGLVIDLSEVSDIDSSCAQMLMLAKRHCQARSLPCALVNHSQAVIDVFETLGLVSWFSDPVVMPGESGTSRRDSADESEGQS